MAVRYSGDVEIRCALLYGETYQVRVRYPRSDGHLYRTMGRATIPLVHAKAGSPEAFDVVAQSVIRSLRRQDPDLPVEYGTRGRTRGNPSIIVRRVYQAPCPETAWKPKAKSRG